MNEEKMRELIKKGNQIIISKNRGSFKCGDEILNKAYFDKIARTKVDVKLVLYYLNNTGFEIGKGIQKNEEIIIKNGEKTPIAWGKYDSEKEKFKIEGFIYTSKEENKTKYFYEEGIKGIVENSEDKNELLDLYCKRLLKKVEYYKNSKVSNKASGLMTYECLKEYFDEKYKNKDIKLSAPNCFIKGFGQEFDALIVNKESYYENMKDEDEDKNKYKEKYFYNLDDVYAVIEIKTLGLFYDKDKLEGEIKKNIINYYCKNDKKNKKQLKPFIYISFYENNEGDDKSYAKITAEKFDEYLKKDAYPNFYSLFIVKKEGSERYTCSNEDDLNKIIDSILEEKKKNKNNS